MSQLRLRFLGGLTIDQGEYSFSNMLAGKALALICYLIQTTKPQTRSFLAGLLWSDFPENRARSNLRDTLSLLRHTALAPYILTSRRSISFNLDLPYWLDTAAFRDGVSRGLQDRPVEISSLESAIAHYRGEFLAGFHISRATLFEEWVLVQRQQLNLLAIEALQQLIDFHLEDGNYELGIQRARQLLTLDNWREETHRSLMLLLLMNGQLNEAVKQYQECRQILAEELSVLPSEETQILYDNVLKQLHASRQGDKVHLVSGESSQLWLVPHNLPGQVTPFIGREDELRTIDDFLSDQPKRLITILGVGGIGKTRLALAVGRRQVKAIQRDGGYRFPDGVFFVSFQAVETPAEMVPALCQAIGFRPLDEGREGRSIERQLLDYLRRKRMLLIIDNFEQLLAGVGTLAKIYRSAPDVHLLITSRQKLSLRGELLYSLSGLSYPKSSEGVIESEKLLTNYSAANLFVATARRVKPDFVIREDEVPALTKICRLVDGLPLAVELAAGWTNLLPLTDIAAEIKNSLSFLESDLYDLPDRHRNMKAVFDVSWDRLSNEAQALFSKMCVFHGGFTRVAAENVTGASLRQLGTLVNKTLIQYDRRHNRYQIHRLLRQFGAEKLAHEPVTERRVSEAHSSFFCETVQHWNELLKGTGQLEALREFEDEGANVRSAWHFAVEKGQFEQLNKMVDGLCLLYLWRRRFLEGASACRLAEDSLSKSLAVKEVGPSTVTRQRKLAKIMTWHSVFCERTKAVELVELALGMLTSLDTLDVDTRCEKAFALRRAGDLVDDSDLDVRRRHYRASLDLYRELKDPWGAANVLTDLGWAAAHLGEHDDAKHLGQEALSLRRSIGDRKGTADALWLLGTLAIVEGHLEESSHLLGESLDIRETMGDRITDIAAGPLDLGMTLTWIGRMTEADDVRVEALALYEALGLPDKIAEAHVRLATSKIHIGDLVAAEHHAQIGLELCGEYGNRRLMGVAKWIVGFCAIISGDLVQAESLFLDSMTIFRTVEGAAEIGWVYGIYAEVARQKGRPVVAKKYIYKALRSASGLLGNISILIAMTVYLILLVDQGQEEWAVELRTLVDKYPIIATSSGAQLLYATQLDQVKQTLPPQIVADAEARGRDRDLKDTVAKVLAELEEDIEH